MPQSDREQYLMFNHAHEQLRAFYLIAHGDPVIQAKILELVLGCTANAKSLVPMADHSVDGVLDPPGPVNRRLGHGSSKRVRSSAEGPGRSSKDKKV
jgi:hypothetical protein